MALTPKTTHYTEALARFVEQFKGNGNLAAIIEATTDQTQDDETVCFELLLERALDTAVGTQLDGLGEIVGEDRNGRSDDDYRLGITAQIKRNVMSGTGNEILEIIALLTSNTHTLTEHFPAALKVVFDDALAEDPVELAANLSKAAGVRATMEYTLRDDDETFTFATGDSVEASTDQGWAGDAPEYAGFGFADGTDAYLITSDNTEDWSEQSNPKAFTLRCSAYAPALDLYAAAGNPDGSNSYLVTSSDGQTWTEQANPSNTLLTSMAWSETLGLFAAAGNAVFGFVYLVTSPDGSVWTQRTTPSAGSMKGMVWADSLGLFVGVGLLSGSALIYTSPDGINWTRQAIGSFFASLNGIAWSESLGRLCAVGSIAGGDALIVISEDGINWTEQPNPQNINLWTVARSEALGLYAAGGAVTGSGAYLVTSPTGEEWTQRSNPKDFPLYGSTGFRGGFIMGGAPDGTDGYLITSQSGESWEEQSNPQNLQISTFANASEKNGGVWAGVELIS